MKPGLPDHDTVLAAITLANRAPSVHNSQPWIWRVGDTALHLYADWTRHVPVTDPDGRDLAISCGAALHHLRVAFAALGWGTVAHRVPNPDDPNHLASVALFGRKPTAEDISLVSAIPARRSDRRLYSSWPIPEQLLEQLTKAAADEGCALRVATDAAAREELLRAIADADREQQDDPAYAAELAQWSGRGSAERDGVRSVLSTALHAGPDDVRLRVFSDPRLAEPSGSYADPDAGVLVVIGTPGDDLADRLRAGAATSAVLLRATGFQLASCLISQPLEVLGPRARVRERVLGGVLHPQLVIRLGWAHINADPLPASQRRPASDVIEPLDP
ncbi:Acg family FMN-binding oxidoreductase [Allokutzneria albata]|uniref:Nitroreductase family protein n=1 Tax=Allokutzneria albata TaxID=211114 RepID=A0A1G9SKP9_ALLAB|nr:nitroreductase family protein [Allokutzneria albata]SDM35992.1 Nitroreductase family protein [Allokutzneria albata]